MENDNIEHAPGYFDTERNKPFPMEARRTYGGDGTQGDWFAVTAVEHQVRKADPSYEFRIAQGGASVSAPKDWRKMLAELGGWDNELLSVPAGAVREIIEEVEALRAAAKVGANVAAEELADLWIHEDMDRDATEAVAGLPRVKLKVEYKDARESMMMWRRRALTAESARIAAGAPAETPKPFAYFVQPSGFGPFIECESSRTGCFPAYRAAQPAAIAGDVEKDAACLGPVSADTALRELGPSCSCPSGDGSLRWLCPVHPPVAL